MSKWRPMSIDVKLAYFKEAASGSEFAEAARTGRETCAVPLRFSSDDGDEGERRLTGNLRASEVDAERTRAEVIAWTLIVIGTRQNVKNDSEGRCEWKRP